MLWVAFDYVHYVFRRFIRNCNVCGYILLTRVYFIIKYHRVAILFGGVGVGRTAWFHITNNNA